ncbi:MAG: hypothetical protein JO069_16195, partial [Verrucomicrobia bacterium]|nr:hypothetical protein [Verrucomicrobiota bacterium]
MEHQRLQQGAYLLRTNLTQGEPETLWRYYLQLTEVENIFRTLKSELNVRPIWHRLQPRPEGAVGRPRGLKDEIEEAFFERRRDLFTEVDLVFFDTASLYFEGAGGEE